MTVAEIASHRLGDKAMTGDAKAFSFLIATLFQTEGVHGMKKEIRR
jgi:hypothetical protein